LDGPKGLRRRKDSADTSQKKCPVSSLAGHDYEMAGESDMDLVRDYGWQGSEAAFAELARRHLDLVYSVALRLTANPVDAEDVTQAVFIILANKAARLRDGTVISGWLYETTRFTASRYLRTRTRRQAREQEACVESNLNEPDIESAWRQLAPDLEPAMSRLAENDRTLIILRYYQNKTMPEAAAALGIREDAARKRTARALEKLRAYFAKRGAGVTAATLAAAISANSVQAVPVALAKTVVATAVHQGAVAGVSSLGLAKGVLKVMAWSKAKTAAVAGACALLAAGTVTVVVEKAARGGSSVLEQRLDDGSALVLNQISFGEAHEFVHGGKTNRWSWPGDEQLVAEFKLAGDRAASHPLVNPAFYRQFRCVLRGDSGFEYVEEFMPDSFSQEADGYYSRIQTGVTPRDSKWLRLRVEMAETNSPYGRWRPIAEFKTPNPARPANLGWIAAPAPATNTVNGMNFVLGDITVKAAPDNPRDIWNHDVNAPLSYWREGARMTNWAPAYIHIGDASGNWEDISILPAWRSLDPRYVWKLDMDMEPVADFPAGSVATVRLPEPRSKIATNVMGMPVTISWDGSWMEASIPTNRPGVALKYVGVSDDQNDEFLEPSGSWGRFTFRKGSFMARKNGVVTFGPNPTKVTFAIVPNVHTTFLAKPRLMGGERN
jgi:RNA polymerase sigma factor (sigma-70 family)